MLLALLAPIVHAASYDPDLTWRTLSTEHFQIHFHGGEEQLAEEMATIVETVYDKMTVELDWIPERPTEVVLIDNTDSANGYAQYLPRNTIVIYVTAPESTTTLSLYENWNDAIFTHEYTHTLHLDTVERWNAALRHVFGRIIAINGLAPGWVVEGQATMQETWHTPAGRGRASIPDMIKRTATISDHFPPLGLMDGFQKENPGGNNRYLFGQDFMNFIAQEHGSQVWTEWNHNYGGGIPYLLPSQKTFGESLPSLYDDWKISMEARYAKQQAEIEAIGLTPYTLLTGEDRNCIGATFSPDGGKLVYSCYTLTEGASVYLSAADGSDEHLEIKGTFGRYFGWRADSNAFAYSAQRTVNRFNLYSDVYLHTVNSSTKMLTGGKRARDPEFRSDGQQLLVVTNKAQNNQLATLTIDQRLAPLTDHTDHTQYSTPRFSPDGKWIVVSKWHDGQRDIWILDGDGTPIQQLSNDKALDTDPRWSADGKRIYFSSDRTGVFNIFAFDLAAGTLYQVSNVLTGAFYPSISPDQETAVFSLYQHYGYAIATMPLIPESWLKIESLPFTEQGLVTTAKFLPIEAIEIKEKGTWEAPDTELEWWQLSKKRQAKNDKAQNSSTKMEIQTEALHYEGLTGIGAATDYWIKHDPYLGMPHQPKIWGEEPGSGPDIQEEASVTKERKEEEDFEFSYPVERYQVSKTLFPPTFIAPGFYRTIYGFMGSLSTSGTDTLRNHFYGASASYRTDSQFLGWSASYTNNQFIPIISMGAYSTTVPYGAIYTNAGPPEDGGAWVETVENTGLRYWDRRIAGYAQVSYAKTSKQSYFARWSMTHRSPWISAGNYYSNAGLPDNAYRPSLPTRGVLSGIGGGWRYVKGSSYSRSISPENTRLISLVGQVQSRYLGSYTLDDNDEKIPFTRVQITGEWREYQSLPWADNHVIALKLASGLSAGDTQRYGSYRLGGSFGESGYYTLPDEWRALRGFDPASVSGDGYYLSSVEYRLPIRWFDWGYQTYPFFLRYLSGSVYLDAGTAFDDVADIGTAPLVGTGAELRASMILSWGAPVSVRVGYGFGLNGGTTFGSLDGFYLWLGSSF